MTTGTLSYAIDEEDRLVRLGSGFYLFAEENGWRNAGECLGRSLWDFVAGEELRNLQRLLLRRVRDERRSIELPFRCDGPEACRELEMRIVASASGRLVLLSTTPLSEEPHAQRQDLLDPAVRRSTETLDMCGWCDRFLVAGNWVEVGEAAARLGLFALDAQPDLRHDICPDCSSLLLAA